MTTTTKTIRSEFNLPVDAPLSAVMPLGNGTNVERNNAYVFPDGVVGKMALAAKSKKNLWISGPAGCGKTDLCCQVANRFEREAYIISFGEETSMRDLIGMFTLSNGETPWKGGALISAISRPMAFVVLDEINMASPGVNAMLNHLLQARELIIHETGETVKVAEGVTFIATANTTGGADETGMFMGSQTQNAATRSRFVGMKMDYLDKKNEMAIINGRVPSLSKVYPELDGKPIASYMVDVGNGIRAMVDEGQVSMAFSVRQLINWAEASVALLPANKDVQKGLAEGFRFAYADMLSTSECDAVAKVYQSYTGMQL